MKTTPIYPAYIGGNFTETKNILEVRNPYNNELIAQTFLCDISDLETAITSAQNCAPELKKLSSYAKHKILLHIAEEILRQKNRLAEILCLESGKPLRFAIAEIERAYQTFLIAAEECKRIPKEYLSLDTTQVAEGRKGLVDYFPIGIVAGISPFNFPMNLAVHKIAPAIACACPILLKPASATPLSVLELAKIIHETDLPKGAISILPMSRNMGNNLVTDERIKLLSFTGSPEVGWEIKKNAGKKKVVLELGGNAGVIISKQTSIDSILKKCIIGAFSYSGQICIHAQRFFVHESLYDEFVSKMKEEAEKLIFGNPLDENTNISVLIDEANAQRVDKWVQEAIRQGASLICGGKRIGSYYSPTILCATSGKMNVWSEEVFGPVCCIEKFSEIRQAVEMVNDSRFGLQCGLFSDSLSEINYCVHHLDVGGIILNDAPTLRFDQMPYGGIKDSGLGREGVKYAMMEMLEPKILVL